MREIVLCSACNYFNLDKKHERLIFACNIGTGRIMEPMAHLKKFESRKIPRGCRYKEEQKFNELQMKAKALSEILKKHRNEIEDIYSECSKHNWDGYEAIPVTQEAKENAFALLNLLVKSLGKKAKDLEVSPTPSGQYVFELRDNGMLITICSSKITN